MPLMKALVLGRMVVTRPHFPYLFRFIVYTYRALYPFVIFLYFTIWNTPSHLHSGGRRCEILSERLRSILMLG